MGEVKKNIITYKGLKKLEDELELYKTVKRRDITEKIRVALSFGDLSENGEYYEAKNDQSFVEGRIIQLENMLRNATIVDESEIKIDVVNVGAIVKIKDLNFDHDLDFEEEMELFIVGSAEADPLENKISNESPIGSGIMGKKVGEVINIPVPDGIKNYEIIGIRRD